MKTIFKSFKFRIYPNKDQEILLAKHFGANRFVFNYYLNKRKENGLVFHVVKNMIEILMPLKTY